MKKLTLLFSSTLSAGFIYRQSQSFPQAGKSLQGLSSSRNNAIQDKLFQEPYVDIDKWRLMAAETNMPSLGMNFHT